MPLLGYITIEANLSVSVEVYRYSTFVCLTTYICIDYFHLPKKNTFFPVFSLLFLPSFSKISQVPDNKQLS